ncbi:LuxR C-terminal-related transcriptional regulator [Actinomycetospora callitridis]|uniref:LuxR C-terminal-related transcriptional regulator n=1 Tax=Actinomycetospora callitridis TaxID=913944 RepID=UPI0023662C72|nr:LuxR C-terminal-related transcriptional regulator [Actinomycetospora callitridis]MDD7921905.1 LuxR C-terminal-related transcriptional regulator [Actinomycetospora callitridis]
MARPPRTRERSVDGTGSAPAATGPGDPAKFAVPVATHVIERPRLLARIGEGAAGGATVIAAAAGWGKSLLVGSWVAQGADGRAVAWVNLDAGDDDVRAFWTTVAAALATVAGDRAGPALARLARSPVGVELPGDLVHALEQADRPLVLVLDNLHEVTSAEVHAGLLRLVERPSPTLSLVITTRRDPPWPLSRLQLTGLVTGIRAADLAFRPDEAAALYAQLGVELRAEQTERMVERTEGWAAGMRLGALHLHGAPDVGAAVATFSGEEHGVSGYLLEEILARQPPDLVHFLTTVSVVDVVCVDLADALTGGSDGAAVLADLAASHLFVQALGRPGRWYRLHRLLLDLLRARPLPRRESRDLHRRAAQWFADQGMTLEALRSAVRGTLWPRATELVSRHLPGLVLRGSARELERVLDGVPRDVLLARPELATALAAARMIQGRPSGVEQLLEVARTGSRDLSGPRRERLHLYHDLILGGRARVAGDLAAASEAYSRIPLDPVALRALDIAETGTVLDLVRSNLGTAELWTGDPVTAEAHLREVADRPGEPLSLPPLNAVAHLALLACDRGDLVEAEEAAASAVAVAEAAGWTRTFQIAPAFLTMARVVFDRGDLPVDTWLGRLAEVEEHAPERHVRLAGSLVRAARHEVAGDPERALGELRATEERLGGWVPPRPLFEQSLLVRAGLHAQAGDVASAGALLDQVGPPRTEAGAVLRARLLLRRGEPAGAREALEQVVGPHPRVRVGAAVVGALLAHADRDEDRALALLEDALLAAAPVGLRRPFLAEPDLAALLTLRVERGGAAGTFAEDLVERMRPASAAAGERRGIVDPLTDRERTALRYLASPLSNAEIAGELYVSVNTVKSHQRAVYRKLGAAGRRDAVRRAHALDLF